MNNGTERDEPGQRGGDERQSPPAPTSGPSSDPVWPVWGGAEKPAGDSTPDSESTGALAPVDDPATDDVSPETSAEPNDEADVEPEAGDEAEAGDAPEAEGTPESDGEPVVDGELEAAESESEADAEPEAGAASPADVEPQVGTESDVEAVDGPATAPEAEVGPEPEAASEAQADDEPEADAEPAAELDPPVAEVAGASDGVAADDADSGVAPVADAASDEEPSAAAVAASDEDLPAAAVAEGDQDAPTDAASQDDADAADDATSAESATAAAAVASQDDADADAASEGDEPVAADAASEGDEPVAADAASEGDEPVAADAGATTSDVAATESDEPVVSDAVAPSDDAVVDTDGSSEDDVAPAPAGDDTSVDPDVEKPGATGTTADADEVDAPTDAAPAATPEPGGEPAVEPDAEPVPTAATPEPANGRDAATAVIAPIAAATAAAATPAAATPAAATPAAAPPAAATPAAATPPAPIGTLAAPVTRTLPSSAAAPTEATPAATAPIAATAAAATAAAAAAAATAKTPVVTTPAPAAPTAPAPNTTAAPTRVSAGPVAGAAAVGAAAAAPPKTPIPSGPVPPSARKESPLDVFEAEDGKRRWPKRLLVALGVVVVLGAVYVGASYWLADRVPRGATVAGVDIGGLPADEAVARLDSELADATTQPIEVVANDVQATIDPVAAGLTFDAQATVDQLTGVDLSEPQRLWQHVVGVGAQEPVTSVDDKALSAALGDLSTSLALAPVDGTIVFVDASAQSTDAVDGWDLDQDGAADVLSEDWLVAPRPIELPTVAVAPDITQAETDAALVEAQKVTSAPVSVEVSEQLALLDTKTLAANAAYVPTDGTLVLQMNGQGLSDAVLAQLPGLLTASADAHFEFVNDAPVIVPGTPGTSLDPAALATSVATAATSSDRTAHVELVEADPSQSTAELEALGVKEIVSEFSTPLTSEPRRTVNITNGASKISGTLIRPGETFSLTDALGPIDAAHGFVEAGAIVSGEHTDAWGGGLSQISTTTYNAAFLAGYEDVEHRPHSEWFARYPEGREATIFTGTLDMRWKNNTPYGALVQAWVSGGRVYVRMWGTKYWTVESITSPRSGVVNPTTVYSQSPTCEASSAGNPGFSVTVTRKTSLNGELKKTESNSWRYKPQNKIICGPPPTAPATP